MDNPALKRRDDESLKDYEYRICLNRHKYGLSWQDVADILNKERGENWSESKYRKWFSNFHSGVEYAQRKGIDSKEILDEIELKKIELLEERKKLQTLRTEYNRIAREKARRELLFEFVRDAFEKIEPVEPVVNLTFDNLEQEHVLAFGDIHFGKKFESLHNEYSEEIAINRMNALIEDTVRYLDKHNVSHLNVLNLGDNIEGMTLRVSQLQSLQSGFVDQVIKFSRYYARWIRELSKYAHINLFHIEQSNHAQVRPYNSTRNEFPAEDLERIIGMYIQDTLKDHDRINIVLGENGVAEFNLLGYEIVALHGHQLKGKKNALKDLSFHRRKFYDYLYIAHWHNVDISTIGESLTNNVQTIQVPSIMGSDPYSDSLFTGAKAGAVITTFTKDKGLTDIHNIILN